MSTERPRTDPRDYPLMAAATKRVEPAPRRVRAHLDGHLVLDTRLARYVWEWPNYPQYYVPGNDVDFAFLEHEAGGSQVILGPADQYALRSGDTHRPGAARVLRSEDPALDGLVRFEWAALDAWFEEDEEIYVHPRNPYVRVDALRSRSRVRVEHDGVVLAETDAPVLLFETGLPTRYYVDRTDVRLDVLTRSETQTPCPYKGRTSAYWSHGELADIAWTYDYPAPAVVAIAGLVAFYNEVVDIFLDGELLPRPRTHFA